MKSEDLPEDSLGGDVADDSNLDSLPEVEFRHESVQDTETIVKYFDAFSAGFAQGRLTLSMGGREIVLEPKGLLDFRVRSKKEGDEVQVSLKISWREPRSRKRSRKDPLVIKPDKN